MAFKMATSDLFRFFLLGTSLVLTIPELALLVVFTRHSVSQGSIHTFEIMGLVVSSLTLLLLPIVIFCPRIAPNAPVALLVFEVPGLVILSGLWVGFVTLEKLQQSKWYPIPKAYKHQKNVSGCQFVPEGEEAHWCGQLASNSALTNTIMALIFVYMLFIVGLSLVLQINGIPFWLRTLEDVVGQKIPARQPQQPQVPDPRSQPPVQQFGGRWKGKTTGILSEFASTSMPDGSFDW